MGRKDHLQQDIIRPHRARRAVGSKGARYPPNFLLQLFNDPYHCLSLRHHSEGPV